MNLFLGIWIVLFFLFLSILTIILINQDRKQIEGYLSELGCKLVNARLAGFSTKKYINKAESFYLVQYLDKEGNGHSARLQKNWLTTRICILEDKITEK